MELIFFRKLYSNFALPIISLSNLLILLVYASYHTTCQIDLSVAINSIDRLYTTLNYFVLLVACYRFITNGRNL
ncbi:hypothetical protein BD770DRAFT_384587 [Pilaira anomala]|nr:hypothetical protein BD770DRAFT_384587 [Pilaira anomala]